MLILTALLLTLLLSGCAQVEITDDTLYFPMGANQGAVVEHTLDAYEAVITAAEFQSVLNSSPNVCMSTDAYGNLKKIYEIFCSDYPTACTWDVQQNANAVFTKTERGMLKQKRGFVKPRR